VRRLTPLALGLVLALASTAHAQEPDRFSHRRHAELFPTCTACHVGVVDGTPAIFPSGQGCAACHDGTTERRVNYTAPAPAATNLRFTHAEHAREVAGTTAPDSMVNCVACHTPTGASWMTVQPAVVNQCLDCHGVRATSHLAAPDSACSTCHLTLAQATGLTTAQIKAFPEPPSHEAPGFQLATGHGAQAKAGTGAATYGVAPSCATCHARDFCLECHVNAPEVPAIQALAPDARSTAIAVTLTAPATHQQSNFLATHGKTARKSVASCQACHTQESCAACHTAPPAPVMSIYPAGAGRGQGAVIVRSRPPSHQADFSDIHAPAATSGMKTCQGCHTRPQCLDCHRGTPERTPQYHPQTFLERHPAAAYARETNCSDCHNPAAFCQACHVQAGLGSPKGALQPGYHDAFPAFQLNHGQAARQSLETCTSCHVEKDCLTCHSALYGRGFNPHGPGFDPQKMLKANPQMCTVCHGQNVPGGK